MGRLKVTKIGKKAGEEKGSVLVRVRMNLSVVLDVGVDLSTAG